MVEKTITVKSINRTPKGVIVTTMAEEEYKYNTAEVDEILAYPGTVANVTIDDKTKIITTAMKLAYLPDTVKLSEQIETAKAKTAEIIKQNTPQKVAPPVRANVKPPPNPTNKSVAISYSKDLLIAGKIMIDDLLPCAEIFYRFMTGELEVVNLYQPLLTNTTAKITGDKSTK
jgi:hypothetical protein